MPELVTYVLTAILSLMPRPSPKWAETPEHYKERVELIAQAIAAGVPEKGIEHNRLQLAMGVVVTFWGETRFNPLYHESTKLSDHNKAICLGQHHRLWRTEESWRALAGLSLEATTRCAEATASGLIHAYYYCAGHQGKPVKFVHAFTLYGTGEICDPRESRHRGEFEKRARIWRALMARPGPVVIALKV